MLLFSITKAESQFTFPPLDYKEFYTTAQTLVNNIWSFNKGTTWKKSVDEFLQVVEDYRPATKQAITDVFTIFFLKFLVQSSLFS